MVTIVNINPCWHYAPVKNGMTAERDSNTPPTPPPPKTRRGGPKRDPNTTAGEKLLKLLNILLWDPKRHYQADLAERLMCSGQTVHRYIGMIERTLTGSLTIHCGSDGPRRFYQLAQPATADTLGVSDEEVRYLALCRDLAKPFLPQETHDRLGQTLRDLATGQAGRVFGAPIGFRTKGTIDYGPHLKTLETLRAAIEGKEICALDYRPIGQKDQKTYRFAPGLIIALNGALYVQGYRLETGSVLPERPSTFLIHRLLSVTPLAKYFRFDAADTEARSFGLHWHAPKRVAIEVDRDAADYVRDRTWSDDQKIDEREDGSLVLHLMTTSEREVQAWVWSFGGLGRVVENVTVGGGQA